MGIILTSKRIDGDKSNKDYHMLRNYTAVALHDFSCSKLLFDLQVFLVSSVSTVSFGVVV